MFPTSAGLWNHQIEPPAQFYYKLQRRRKALGIAVNRRFWPLMDFIKSPKVKAGTNMYGNKINGCNPSINITQNGFSERSSRTRDGHGARRNSGNYKENRRVAVESVKAKAEPEFSCAMKMVKDIGLMTEESKGDPKLEKEDIEKLQTSGQQEVKGLGKSNENHQHEEILRELELMKQELSRLKLYVAGNGELKIREDKEMRESSTEVLDSGSSTEANRKGAEEVNDEQEIFDESKIEALKGFEEVEAQRTTEANEVSPRTEDPRKSHETIEVEKSVDSEHLSEPLSNINILRTEMNLMREKDSKSGRRKENLMPLEVGASESQESEAPALLEIITEELGKAKTELTTVRNEGFQFKSSMDVIRNELMHVKTETRRLERMEEKTEVTVKNLNAKLHKAKSKLENVTAVEEKAQSLVNKFTVTLEKLNTQRDTANKEKEAIREEVQTMKAEIRKTEFEIDKTEATLQMAMQELEETRNAEGLALEKLNDLVEKAKGERYSGDQHSSLITISKFEYEYLTRYAAGAEDIADKKIAAAQAWIEALKASEKETLMKIEKAKKHMNETKMEGETNVPAARNSGFEKQEAERELDHWKGKREEEAEQYLQRRTSENSRNRENMSTTERPKPHKSASSQGGQKVSSSRKKQAVTQK